MLRGAVDAEYKVARVDDTVHLTNHKMKDAAPPPAMTFDLIESAGSVALEYTGEPKGKGGKQPARHSKALLGLNIASANGPASTEAWRTAFYALYNGTDAAKRQAFNRAVKDLTGSGTVIMDADRYKLAPMPGMPER